MASATLLDAGFRGEPAVLPALWLWTLLEPLGDRIDDWMLAPLIRELFGRAGAEPAVVEDAPALMSAAGFNQNPDVTTTVLKADAKTKDDAGKTAFDYAQDNESLKGTDAYWKLNDARY